jgi:hypothetical protein
VNVTSVNVGTLDTALNSTTGFNDVLYIYDTTSASTPNAIRLTNGGVLPSNGLTVASMNPVYIQGDYNTGTTNNPNAVPANVGNSSDTASPRSPATPARPPRSSATPSCCSPIAGPTRIPR